MEKQCVLIRLYDNNLMFLNNYKKMVLCYIFMSEGSEMIVGNKTVRNTRVLVMGVATVGILLVHSINIVKWPAFMQKLFEFGGLGVYIFVFLSSIGLYNSLKIRGGGGIVKEIFISEELKGSLSRIF